MTEATRARPLPREAHADAGASETQPQFDASFADFSSSAGSPAPRTRHAFCASDAQYTRKHARCCSDVFHRTSTSGQPSMRQRRGGALAAMARSMAETHLDTPKITCRSSAPFCELAQKQGRLALGAAKPPAMNFTARLAPWRTAVAALVPARRVCMQNSNRVGQNRLHCAPPRHDSAFMLN